MRYLITTALLASFWFCPCSSAQLVDAFYTIATAPSEDFTSIGTPACNKKGDVVLRARAANDGDYFYYAYLDNKPYKRVKVVQQKSLSGRPRISDSRSVSGIQGGNPLYLLIRNDYANGMYTTTTLAVADPGLTNDEYQFESFGPVAPFGDGNAIAVWGDPKSANHKPGVYEFSEPDVLWSASRLTEADGFALIGERIDSSAAGWVAFADSLDYGEGIYLATAPHVWLTVASKFSGHSGFGVAPSVNEAGNVAFISGFNGSPPVVRVVFTKQQLEVDTAALGSAPGLVSEFTRPSINSLNQVAYLGVTPAGKAAIYSTNLGATRVIASVGRPFLSADPLSEVESLEMDDGLMDNGQVVFYAATLDGKQHAVRASRAYYQRKVFDDPAEVPWETWTLLDGTSSFKDYGCNLTTQTNLLSYYGHSIAPVDVNDWYYFKDKNAAPEYENHYIDGNHHFIEGRIAEFSWELSKKQGFGNVVVHHTYLDPKEDADANLALVVSELRAGRAVKLRVPSVGVNKKTKIKELKPIGHFVLVYGFKDPTVSDEDVGMDDLLVHDCGHGGVTTLADYDALQADDELWLDGWLNDTKRRVYTYRGNIPYELLKQLTVQVYSPVAPVLTNDQGQRLGFDPDLGELDEIPDSAFWVEETSWSLDTEGDLEPIWGDQDPVKTVLVRQAEGNYSLELIGTGEGAYTVVLSGVGPWRAEPPLIEGTTEPGKRETFVVTLVPAGDSCPADCDGSGILDLFDFLCFVNLFNAGDVKADCDDNQVYDLFDFLCFVNLFNEGC